MMGDLDIVTGPTPMTSPRLHPPLVALVDRLAAAEGVTRSEWWRRALVAEIARKAVQ